MRKFQDNTGREWILSITLDAIERVEASIGVDLSAPSSGEPALWHRLMTSRLWLVRVLWALVKPQAGAMSKEAFYSALTGDALAGAFAEFWQEYPDFFPSLGQQEIGKGLKTILEVMAQLKDKGREQIEKVDLQAIVAEHATSWPESSESTLDP